MYLVVCSVNVVFDTFVYCCLCCVWFSLRAGQRTHVMSLLCPRPHTDPPYPPWPHPPLLLLPLPLTRVIFSPSHVILQVSPLSYKFSTVSSALHLLSWTRTPPQTHKKKKKRKKKILILLHFCVLFNANGKTNKPSSVFSLLIFLVPLALPFSLSLPSGHQERETPKIRISACKIFKVNLYSLTFPTSPDFLSL